LETTIGVVLPVKNIPCADERREKKKQKETGTRENIAIQRKRDKFA
jgi:hypothetical protein